MANSQTEDDGDQSFYSELNELPKEKGNGFY